MRSTCACGCDLPVRGGLKYRARHEVKRLCKCGCGKGVKHPTALFTRGHAPVQRGQLHQRLSDPAVEARRVEASAAAKRTTQVRNECRQRALKQHSDLLSKARHVQGTRRGWLDLGRRARTGAQAAMRWLDPVYRSKVFSEEAQLRRAASRADYLKTKTSKLNAVVARVLRDAGLSFEAECRIGLYLCDFVFQTEKVVLEVQGCWWHACLFCQQAAKYEVQKQNLKNDIRKRAYLERAGWTVLYLWEHEVVGR